MTRTTTVKLWAFRLMALVGIPMPSSEDVLWWQESGDVERASELRRRARLLEGPTP